FSDDLSVKWTQIQNKPTRSVGFAYDLPPERPNPIISVYSWVEPTLRAAEFLIQHHPPSFPRRREFIENFKK
ncbi:hypothetical protein, partial [Neisseria sicca]|uniref:hypothetical protein n=1 Tax=Neisseria sicca TaxID=490 RepID=UPI0020D236B8